MCFDWCHPCKDAFTTIKTDTNSFKYLILSCTVLSCCIPISSCPVVSSFPNSLLICSFQATSQIFHPRLSVYSDQNHPAPYYLSFPPSSDLLRLRLHLYVTIPSVILKYLHPCVYYVCVWYLWGAYVICVCACAHWRGRPHLSSAWLLARTLWCAFRMAVQLSALPLAWQLFISFETALVDIRLSGMASFRRGQLNNSPRLLLWCRNLDGGSWRPLEGQGRLWDGWGRGFEGWCFS